MATSIATYYVGIVPTVDGVQGQLMRQLVPQVGAAAPCQTTSLMVS